MAIVWLFLRKYRKHVALLCAANSHHWACSNILSIRLWCLASRNTRFGHNGPVAFQKVWRSLAATHFLTFVFHYRTKKPHLNKIFSS